MLSPSLTLTFEEVQLLKANLPAIARITPDDGKYYNEIIKKLEETQTLLDFLDQVEPIFKKIRRPNIYATLTVFKPLVAAISQAYLRLYLDRITDTVDNSYIDQLAKLFLETETWLRKYKIQLNESDYFYFELVKTKSDFMSHRDKQTPIPSFEERFKSLASTSVFHNELDQTNLATLYNLCNAVFIPSAHGDDTLYRYYKAAVDYYKQLPPSEKKIRPLLEQTLQTGIKHLHSLAEKASVRKRQLEFFDLAAQLGSVEAGTRQAEIYSQQQGEDAQIKAAEHYQVVFEKIHNNTKQPIEARLQEQCALLESFKQHLQKTLSPKVNEIFTACVSRHWETAMNYYATEATKYIQDSDGQKYDSIRTTVKELTETMESLIEAFPASKAKAFITDRRYKAPFSLSKALAYDHGFISHTEEAQPAFDLSKKIKNYGQALERALKTNNHTVINEAYIKLKECCALTDTTHRQQAQEFFFRLNYYRPTHMIIDIQSMLNFPETPAKTAYLDNFYLTADRFNPQDLRLVDALRQHGDITYRTEGEKVYLRHLTLKKDIELADMQTIIASPDSQVRSDFVARFRREADPLNPKDMVFMKELEKNHKLSPLYDSLNENDYKALVSSTFSEGIITLLSEKLFSDTKFKNLIRLGYVNAAEGLYKFYLGKTNEKLPLLERQRVAYQNLLIFASEQKSESALPVITKWFNNKLKSIEIVPQDPVKEAERQHHQLILAVYKACLTVLAVKQPANAAELTEIFQNEIYAIWIADSKNIEGISVILDYILKDTNLKLSAPVREVLAPFIKNEQKLKNMLQSTLNSRQSSAASSRSNSPDRRPNDPASTTATLAQAAAKLENATLTPSAPPLLSAIPTPERRQSISPEPVVASIYPDLHHPSYPVLSDFNSNRPAPPRVQEPLNLIVMEMVAKLDPSLIFEAPDFRTY